MAALLWLMPIALAGLGLRLWWHARAIQGYGRDGERLVGAALERLLPAVVHDVILPTARGGLTQIDHLALTPKGLLVVETKHYRGTILGTPEDRQWVQQRDGRRRLFQNPCRQNYAHLKAVEALGLDVPILELVVFTDSAQFPNGLPDGVSQLARLEADLAPWRRGRMSAQVAAGLGVRAAGGATGCQGPARAPARTACAAWLGSASAGGRRLFGSGSGVGVRTLAGVRWPD
jgi:restriction system protein